MKIFTWLMPVVIVLGAVLIFSQTRHHEFVTFDDDFHVYLNPNVQTISPETVKSIWTSKGRAQTPKNRLYIPLTFSSFQLEHALFGAEPAHFHVTNVILHVLNTFLVFWFFGLLFEKKWVAFFCAVVFLTHPLNVEPVAWVSGRKDLLSALFLLSALISYWFYVHEKRLKFLWLCAGLFLAALLSKPAVASFSIVMFLLDYLQGRKLSRASIFEKIPFFALGCITSIVNASGYGLHGAGGWPSMERLIFSLRTVPFYLENFFYPVGLSAFYPFPKSISLSVGDLWALSIFLIGIVLLVVLGRRLKVVLFGFGFFLVMLLPSFIRTTFYSDGGFASDRYMYLAMVGVIAVLGVSVKKLFAAQFCAQKSKRVIAAILIGLACIPFSFLSYGRAQVWRTTETMSLDIVKHYPNAANAQASLGRTYAQRGNKELAKFHYQKALKAHPSAYHQALVYELDGEYEKAIENYSIEIDRDPHSVQAFQKLGRLLWQLKRNGDSLEVMERAVAQNPYHAGLWRNLGVVAFEMGDLERAAFAWERALQLNPEDDEARRYLEKV